MQVWFKNLDLGTKNNKYYYPSSVVKTFLIALKFIYIYKFIFNIARIAKFKAFIVSWLSFSIIYSSSTLKSIHR